MTTMERILGDVAQKHGLSPDVIRWPRRGPKTRCIARHEAMRLCHEEGYSTTEIGTFFRRDHSSVVYAIHGNHRKVDCDGTEEANA